MKKIFFAAIAALAIFACNKQVKSEEIPAETGGLRLSIAGDPTIELVTKSTEVNIDYSKLAVKILAQATNEPVHTFAYAEVPEVITLDKGDYKVLVETQGVALPAFNTPVFRGEETFTITPGEVSQLKVTVAAAVAKVSIVLDKSFTDEVTEDYSVTLIAHDGETIIFKKENIAADDAAFLAPADFDLVIKAIRKTTGAPISKAYTISDVKAKHHYTFTVRAIATGSVSLDDFIQIDDNYTDRGEDVLVDGFEQDPIIDPEDPKDPEPEEPAENNIVITAPGITAPVTYLQGQGLPAGEKFIMSATVPEGVAKFEVSVPSKELQGMLDAVDQPYSVDLASMSGDQLDFWGGLLGIMNPATEVLGKTQVDFDVTTFIALMPADTNIMNLKVTDAKGQTKEAKVQIIIKAN